MGKSEVLAFRVESITQLKDKWIVELSPAEITKGEVKDLSWAAKQIYGRKRLKAGAVIRFRVEEFVERKI